MTSTKLYGRDRDAIWEQHNSRLSGNRNSLICVISSEALSQAATTALDKSFSAIGYGEEPCTYLTLDTSVDDKALFSIVEGIDPIIVVIADGASIEACQKAWRQPIPVHTQTKVFGRRARAFANLDSWVADDKNKQRVWGLLKTLTQ